MRCICEFLRGIRNLLRVSRDSAACLPCNRCFLHTRLLGWKGPRNSVYAASATKKSLAPMAIDTTSTDLSKYKGTDHSFLVLIYRYRAIWKDRHQRTVMNNATVLFLFTSVGRTVFPNIKDWFCIKPFSHNSWAQPKGIVVVRRTLPDIKIHADQAVKLIRKVCFGDFQAVYHCAVASHTIKSTLT